MFRFRPLFIWLLAGSSAFAASRSGRIVDAAGHPSAHTTVIVKETLEGVTTDEDGNFTLEFPDQGSATLVITPSSGTAIERVIPFGTDAVNLALGTTSDGSLEMAPVTVQASVYPTGSAPGAALSALEVVTTPGADADINRTLQTLPGVQNVDEGDALYIRGGDYWETGTYINRAYYPNALRLEAPTGTFVGTVNPFLTQSISFNSGGFGARYGNLLSGLVALETQDAPLVPAGTLNLGIGAVSLGGAYPFNSNFGIRGSATRLDLGPMIRLNGSAVNFAPAPHGHDLSGSAIWEYRPGAVLKFFAIEQENALGVRIDQPSYSGVYKESRTQRFGVLSWSDTFEKWSPQISLSAGESRVREDLGNLSVRTTIPSQRLLAQTGYVVDDQLHFNFGAEAEKIDARIVGRKPASFDIFGPNAASEDIGAQVNGTRTAAFAEADWLILPRLRSVVGLRTDDSSLSGHSTWDPRASLAFRWAKGVYLTAAGGVYHQIADPTFYNPAIGGADLPAMKATHEIVGLQWGEKEEQLRIEFYDKGYSDLTQLTRDRLVARDGRGRSRGMDIYARTLLPGKIKARVTMSFLDAERTDPDTGLMARAPFGIRNSTTLILQRSFSHGIETGLSWRLATGKPFTEIVGANYDPSQHAYVPLYGDPDAARLPEYQRVDLSVSKLTQFGRHGLTVFYLSLSNVLGRSNIYQYTYSYDYRTRTAVPSLFNRSVYFGVSLIYR